MCTAEELIKRIEQLKNIGCKSDDFGFKYQSENYPNRSLIVTHFILHESENWETIMVHFNQRKELMDNNPNFEMPEGNYHSPKASIQSLLFYNLTKPYKA